MKNIEIIKDQKEKILSFKKEINDKIENNCKKEIDKLSKKEGLCKILFEKVLSSLIKPFLAVSGGMTICHYASNSESFFNSLRIGFIVAIVMLLVGLVSAGISVALARLITSLVFSDEKCCEKEKKYEDVQEKKRIIINNEKRHYVFDKEEIKKYYKLLNEIFAAELDERIKSTKRKADAAGSFILLDSLFDQALEKLNK